VCDCDSISGAAASLAAASLAADVVRGAADIL